MKKFFLSFFVIATSAGYSLYRFFGGSDTNVIEPLPQPSGQTVPSAPTVTTPRARATTSTPVTKPVATPTPAPAPKPKGQYVDGIYTGNSVDVYYGYVQVQAMVSGGRLASVSFLSYPNDRSTSRYINGQAMPQLESEAIQAQSANVSGVSGASDTSVGFRESLGNALAQAKS